MQLYFEIEHRKIVEFENLKYYYIFIRYTSQEQIYLNDLLIHLLPNDMKNLVSMIPKSCLVGGVNVFYYKFRKK